ncbi:MAG: dihydroxyacetone kinase, C-terminal domain [Methylococcaceae bacterium NSP1-2]|nr:dihydroxyacetone kinase subunit L [Methylococcaceae bacterium]OYV16896.1 MAG: dihydroxyacetone kinase, C-terminal domain [Methylococcaceae bacterium NSP1-2]
MPLTPALLPRLIEAVANAIASNAEEVTALDQAIGDGDHVINLQRGLNALMAQREELSQLDWVTAWQKMGMILMSTIGGASGSLFGTLFVTMSKAARDQSINQQTFAMIFKAGVESVKQRGKADAGEKTMLDVLIPVADYLQTAIAVSLPELLETVPKVAIAGMESTRDMLATKGRASYLEERSLGHIDAGARTSQLMICAIVAVLAE